ncbi:MAG TPA: outer membrane protein assembly factor BamD [Chitinophagaceae bacterium]|nr:outer membrane protein assembly factor BamD [Chitinophagales bacterium]HPG12328.1 outer membrane protein assembly factor BamD [Chitinophagaceae bacterium]
MSNILGRQIFQHRRYSRALLLIIPISFLFLTGCGKGMSKLLKNPDPAFKLRKAEQFFVDKKYSKAQLVYEDVMPYYKTSKEFEDIYYKYAYCAYYLSDYTNAENLFKSYLEIFPNSSRAEEVDYMRAYTYFKRSPKSPLDQTNTVKSIGMMQTFINTHPGSARIKEANEIIEQCRRKLEIKDFNSAQLYFDLGQFRAAGVSFTTLLNSYPESQRADEYKLMVIKSYFRFAEMSIEEKKVERYEQVITECQEFTDRFPESKLKKEADEFLQLSQKNIKTLTNEQT